MNKSTSLDELHSLEDSDEDDNLPLSLLTRRNNASKVKPPVDTATNDVNEIAVEISQPIAPADVTVAVPTMKEVEIDQEDDSRLECRPRRGSVKEAVQQFESLLDSDTIPSLQHPDIVDGCDNVGKRQLVNHFIHHFLEERTGHDSDCSHVYILYSSSYPFKGGQKVTARTFNTWLEEAGYIRNGAVWSNLFCTKLRTS